MSVKLSELLEAATFHLNRAAKRFENESWDDLAADELSDKAVAFRAIAPALVEHVAANNEFECVIMSGKAPDAVDAWTRVTDRTNAAWRALLTAMKEAGVTCE